MTVITNVVLLTMDTEFRIFSSGYLRFNQDKIVDLGSMKNYKQDDKETVIDGKGGILMPGMINTHTHLGMIPFRGLQDDAVDRLRRFLLPAEKEEMSEELVYASSKYAMAELLLSGVTTVMDMYYFEKEVAKAADEMHIRAFLGETVINQETCDASTPQDSLKYSESFMSAYASHSLITPCAAPHSTVTCTEEILKKAHDLAKKYDVPFTLHVSEMDYELKYFREKYNQTPIEFLNTLGVVDEKLLAAHCIFMTENDCELFRRGGASVAHCIGANTKAAKGVAPVKEMLESGIVVGLGTDGPSSGNTLDILTQFKLFADFHKTYNHDRSAFPAQFIVNLGTMGGAKALGINDCTGSLEAGKQADLVLLETKSVNMFPLYDPYSLLVYSANSKNVDSVFVAGQCLVKNGILQQDDLTVLRENLYRIMTKNKESLFTTQLLH